VKCSIPECDGQARARGMCTKHYQAEKKNGSLPTQWNRAQRAPAPIEEKLVRGKRVSIETGCWEWTGQISEDGYGKVPISRGRYALVHIVSYRLAAGVIPSGSELDHLCRNRKCFNPKHLEAVTHKVNVNRGLLPAMMRDKSAAQTHCKNGHPFSGENLILQGPEKKFRVCRICRSERQRRRYHQRKLKEKCHEGI
jgi:hypothetical protein